MLITIDIGNTNISLGIFDGDKKSFTARLATQRERTIDQYAAELLIIFSLNKIDSNAIDGSIISSVVPELTNTISGAIEKVTGCESMILSPGIKTGLKIVTDCHSQVGADLVAASVGAIAKYPLPCLVVDLGTATKIILIDESGTFRGCTISAGVKISLDALSQKTSQLPAISLKTPSTAIGTNTTDCMLAGTVLGTAAMLDGLCERMEKEFGSEIKTTVATGGYSHEIIKSCYREMIYDKDILLDGLKVIYNKNIK
ncbi:MAG: type III pantothenate kinase [Clostridia bacterium]|nr:type III pantothenate kinase [Clostridia bacterium]